MLVKIQPHDKDLIKDVANAPAVYGSHDRAPQAGGFNNGSLLSPRV